MNAEFNWWLLIVGLVLGAALTWLVMADSTRREIDITEAERPAEALWIAGILAGSDRPMDATQIEEVLRLHREYLALPPPDDPVAAAATDANDGPADAPPQAATDA